MLGLFRGLAIAGTDADGAGTVVAWDFGYMVQKAEVVHTFFVRNDGAEPRVVDKIKAGCSCTSVSRVTEPIPPGDSVPITITFKSGRYQDRIRKTTLVFCDGLEEPAYRLVISAHVLKKGEADEGPLVRAERLEWRIADGRWEQSADTVWLINRSDDTLAFGLAEPSRGLVEIEHSASIPPGETAAMILRPTPTPPPEDSELDGCDGGSGRSGNGTSDHSDRNQTLRL